MSVEEEIDMYKNVTIDEIRGLWLPQQSGG